MGGWMSGGWGGRARLGRWLQHQGPNTEHRVAALACTRHAAAGGGSAAHRRSGAGPHLQCAVLLQRGRQQRRAGRLDVVVAARARGQRRGVACYGRAHGGKVGAWLQQPASCAAPGPVCAPAAALPTACPSVDQRLAGLQLPALPWVLPCRTAPPAWQADKHTHTHQRPGSREPLLFPNVS